MDGIMLHQISQQSGGDIVFPAPRHDDIGITLRGLHEGLMSRTHGGQIAVDGVGETYTPLLDIPVQAADEADVGIGITGMAESGLLLEREFYPAEDEDDLFAEEDSSAWQAVKKTGVRFLGALRLVPRD